MPTTTATIYSSFGDPGQCYNERKRNQKYNLLEKTKEPTNDSASFPDKLTKINAFSTPITDQKDNKSKIQITITKSKRYLEIIQDTKNASMGKLKNSKEIEDLNKYKDIPFSQNNSML